MSETIWGQNKSNFRKNSSIIYNVHAGNNLIDSHNLPTTHIPLDLVTYQTGNDRWCYTVTESASAIHFDDNTLNLQYLDLLLGEEEYSIPLSMDFYSLYFTKPEIKSTRIILNDFDDVYIINFVEAQTNTSGTSVWAKDALFIHRFGLSYDGLGSIIVTETIYFVPIIMANKNLTGGIGGYSDSITYNTESFDALTSGVGVGEYTLPESITENIDLSQFIDFAYKDNNLYVIFKYNFVNDIMPNYYLYTILYNLKFNFNTLALTTSTLNAGTDIISSYNDAYYKESFYNVSGYCLSDDYVIFGTGKSILKSDDDVEFVNGKIYLLHQTNLTTFGTFEDVYCRDVITFKTNDLEEYVYVYNQNETNAELKAYNFLPTYPYINDRFTYIINSDINDSVQLSAVESDDRVLIGIKNNILRIIDDSYYAGISEDDKSWINNFELDYLLLDPGTVYYYNIVNDPYQSIKVKHINYDLKICDDIRYSEDTYDITAKTLYALAHDALVIAYKYEDGHYALNAYANPSPPGATFEVTENNSEDLTALDSHIIIKFEYNIDPTSFIIPYCTISYLTNSATSYIDYTYEIYNNCENEESYLELIPSTSYPEGTVITVSLSDDITSVWGSNLETYSFTFTSIARQTQSNSLFCNLIVRKINYAKNIKSTITILSPDYIASRMMNILPDIYNNSHSTNIYKIFYTAGREYNSTIQMLSILYSDLYLNNWRIQSGTLLVNGRGMYQINFKSAYMTIPESSNVIVVPSQDSTPFTIYNLTKYGFNLEIDSDAVDVVSWVVIGQVGAIWEENFGDALYNNHGALIDLERYLYFKPYICPQLSSANDRDVISVFTKDYTTPIYYQTHVPASTNLAEEKIWLRDTEIPRADYQYRRILKAVFSSLVIGPTYTGVLYGLSSFFKQPGYNSEDNSIYNTNAPSKYNLISEYSIPDNLPKQRVGIPIEVIDLAQNYNFDEVNFTTISSADAIRSYIGTIVVDRYNRLYTMDVTSQARIWYQKFSELSIDNNNGIMLKVTSELIDQVLLMKSINDDDEVDKFPMLEIQYYDDNGNIQTFRIQSQQFILATNVFKNPYASSDFIDYTDNTFYLAGGANPARILIKFNLDILPQNVIIKTATLKLFFSSGITIKESFREKIALSETRLSKGKLFGPSYNKFRFNVHVYKYDLLDNSYPGDHAFGYLLHEYEVNEVTNLILKKIKPANTQYAIYYYKERIGLLAGNIYEDIHSMKYYDKCFNNSAKGYKYINPLEVNAIKKASYLYNGKTFFRDF